MKKLLNTGFVGAILVVGYVVSIQLVASHLNQTAPLRPQTSQASMVPVPAKPIPKESPKTAVSDQKTSTENH